MKQLILDILNSQYRDWIMFSINIALGAVGVLGTIFLYIKRSMNKRKKKKNLPWVGRMGGINKNNKNI